MTKNSRVKGMWMMAAASVLFATGGLVLKYVDWNPLAINGMRSIFGAIVIGIFLLAVHHPLRFNKVVLLGAVAYSSMTTLFVMANKMTTAANAIVLQYTAPIWIIIINMIFFHKKPQKYQVVTILLVMLGIGCFFFSSLKSGHVAGDLIAVASGLTYGLLFMLNSIPDGDALSSVFIGQCISSIVFIPWMLQIQDFTWPTMVSIVWLGAFQVGLAYVFFSLSTSLIPPLQASLICGIEPVLNPLLVAIFYHESLSPLALAGAAIVFISVLGSSLYAQKLSPEAA